MIEWSGYETIGRIVVYFIAIYLGLKLLKGFYTCYLAHVLGLGVVWKPSPNTWAVITGATDGIGLQFAHRLADKGYSLLIVSRNEDKLLGVRSDLLAKNPKCCYVRTLAVDFTKADIYESIESELNDLESIDVLVNNVGMSFKIGEYFTKIPNLKQFIDSVINCNIISTTKMISLVLPKMVVQKHGIIINVSSLSASNPIPLLSIYSASKVYCDYLSRALHYEYKSEGIVIQSLLPGFVATNMSAMRPSFTCPTAPSYVSEAIKTVGIESRTYGHYAHKLIGFIQDRITTFLGSQYNSKLVFNHLKHIRRKYYRKHGING